MEEFDAIIRLFQMKEEFLLYGYDIIDKQMKLTKYSVCLLSSTIQKYIRHIRDRCLVTKNLIILDKFSISYNYFFL